jgi:hypothetical protein
MKVIIAGSRTLSDPLLVTDAVWMSGFGTPCLPSSDGRNITEVVCGCARGIDRLGYWWAKARGIPASFWPAWADQYDWATEVLYDAGYRRPEMQEFIHYERITGKKAGPMRNRRMGDYAEALIAIWDGRNRKNSGTMNMYDYMESIGKPVFLHTPNGTKQIGKWWSRN